MPYGTIKVDNIVFTNSGVDQTIGVSGLVQSVSGNLTATGTISGNLIRGTTVSGATITGQVLTVTSGIFSSGTASAPSIGFTGDGNTGFWTPAGDAVALSTGGSERLRVDSDGDLGVGTTDPTSRLTVRADAASGPNTIIRVENRAASAGATTQNIKIEGIFDYNNGTSDASAGAIVFGKDGTYTTATTNNDSYLALETVLNNTSTERLRITSDGKVGVGTSSPDALLTVNGVGAFGAGSASAPSIAATGDLNTGMYFPGADQVAITTGGTGRLFVDSNGNVGIGGAPTNYAGYINLVHNGSSGATYEQRIAGTLTGSLTTDTQLTLKSITSIPLVFGTNNTERLRITSDGKVGVGTSSPDALLTVNGVGAFGAGSASAPSIAATGDLNTGMYFPGADQVAISTGGTGRLFVDASGRVLVGTATAVIGSPIEILSFGNGNALGLRGRSSDNLSYLSFHQNASATEYARIQSNGDSSLSIHTGSAGTERLRIDSAGRLLLGTSASRAASGLAALSQVETTGYGALSLVNNTADSGGVVVTLGKTRSATVGGSATVSNGDNLGTIYFNGADGSGLSSIGASITVNVDGTPGANDMPGRLVMSVTLDGAASPTEAFRITNDRVHCYNQADPAAVNTTATLTVANLKTGLITSTTAAAVTMTLPTGTDTEAGFSGIYTNMTFEWSVINTGATNAVTVQGGTGHTLVGSGTVAASNSGRFASRRTAANTFVTYRLSS